MYNHILSINPTFNETCELVCKELITMFLHTTTDKDICYYCSCMFEDILIVNLVGMYENTTTDTIQMIQNDNDMSDVHEFINELDFFVPTLPVRLYLGTKNFLVVIFTHGSIVVSKCYTTDHDLIGCTITSTIKEVKWSNCTDTTFELSSDHMIQNEDHRTMILDMAYMLDHMCLVNQSIEWCRSSIAEYDNTPDKFQYMFKIYLLMKSFVNPMFNQLIEICNGDSNQTIEFNDIINTLIPVNNIMADLDCFFHFSEYSKNIPNNECGEWTAEDKFTPIPIQELYNFITNLSDHIYIGDRLCHIETNDFFSDLENDEIDNQSTLTTNIDWIRTLISSMIHLLKNSVEITENIQNIEFSRSIIRYRKFDDTTVWDQNCFPNLCDVRILIKSRIKQKFEHGKSSFNPVTPRRKKNIRKSSSENQFDLETLCLQNANYITEMLSGSFKKTNFYEYESVVHVLECFDSGLMNWLRTTCILQIEENRRLHNRWNNVFYWVGKIHHINVGFERNLLTSGIDYQAKILFLLDPKVKKYRKKKTKLTKSQKLLLKYEKENNLKCIPIYLEQGVDEVRNCVVCRKEKHTENYICMHMGPSQIMKIIIDQVLYVFEDNVVHIGICSFWGSNRMDGNRINNVKIAAIKEYQCEGPIQFHYFYNNDEWKHRNDLRLCTFMDMGKSDETIFTKILSQPTDGPERYLIVMDEMETDDKIFITTYIDDYGKKQKLNYVNECKTKAITKALHETTKRHNNTQRRRTDMIRKNRKMYKSRLPALKRRTTKPQPKKRNFNVKL